MKKEKLRKELEVERIKLARAKEVHRRREEEEERRGAAIVVEKHRQEVSLSGLPSSLARLTLTYPDIYSLQKLQQAYLAQQHRLQQQKQQRQLAVQEEQRRRFLEQRQQQQHHQQSSSLGGLEQLFTLLSGLESPRLEVEQPVEQKVRLVASSPSSSRFSFAPADLLSLFLPYHRPSNSPLSEVSISSSPSLKLSKTVPSLELAILSVKSRRKRR